MYCTTPTSCIYGDKDDFHAVRENCLGDANVPSSTITAHSGNEQVITVICAYVSADWNYFYILKG